MAVSFTSRLLKVPERACSWSWICMALVATMPLPSPDLSWISDSTPRSWRMMLSIWCELSTVRRRERRPVTSSNRSCSCLPSAFCCSEKSTSFAFACSAFTSCCSCCSSCCCGCCCKAAASLLLPPQPLMLGLMDRSRRSMRSCQPAQRSSNDRNSRAQTFPCRAFLNSSTSAVTSFSENLISMLSFGSACRWGGAWEAVACKEPTASRSCLKLPASRRPAVSQSLSSCFS
mmetsp:Transcript_22320/g.48823  ORF Transcript_22320/g.48823 Transcript_22320/m.48823 type:complete len:231 (-) Transcript_22320:2099-2791(-)